MIYQYWLPCFTAIGLPSGIIMILSMVIFQVHLRFENSFHHSALYPNGDRADQGIFQNFSKCQKLKRMNQMVSSTSISVNLEVNGTGGDNPRFIFWQIL